MLAAAMKFKDTPWMKSCDQSRWHIKKQRHTLPTKVRLVKAMVFPVVMYGCESWTIKKAEIQPVHSKGDQSWVFIGGTDVEAETSILWPSDAKS